MIKNQTLYLFLKITQITTGAPMKAVTALIGRLPSNPGILATRLHNRLITIPMSITPGTNTLWSLVLKMNLVRCGIANPRNAIGPQNAVTIAVR